MATNRAGRSVSLKKIKISGRVTRVPRLKEALCIISRSLRSKRVDRERKKKKTKNPSKRFNYRIESKSFHPSRFPVIAIFDSLLMLVNEVNRKFLIYLVTSIIDEVVELFFLFPSNGRRTVKGR